MGPGPKPGKPCDVLNKGLAVNMWMFPKIGGKPQNGWFIMENPIKMDLETPICFFL